MPSVVAKVKCTKNKPIPHAGDSRQVELVAVYSEDPTSPNYSWSKWTPSGTFILHVSNPAAYESFVEGEEYMVTFNPVKG